MMTKQYKISIEDTQTVTASNEDEAIQMVQETLNLANLNYDVEEVDDDNVKISTNKSKWSLTAEQQKDLEKKDWEVIPECKFLDLYREDFTSDSVWQEVCDVFNKRYKKHITLLTVGIITEEDKNE